MELTKQPQSMSSLEIAELTGKQHKHIMADCRNMFSMIKIDAADFSASQKYGNNNTREIYNLDKRLTLTLISGYDIALRFTIIKRWEELELQAAPKPLTIEQILQQSLDKINSQQKTIEAQQPAVEFCQKLSACADSIKIGDFAKIISSDKWTIGQNRLFVWLRDNKYLMAGNKPYQNYIDNGYFEVVEGVVINSASGRTWSTTKLTGKGQVAIGKKLQAHFSTELVK